MRRLVNKGAEIAPIGLLTDRGAYFNGQDNYIDTGFVPDLSQDFTLIVTMAETNAAIRHGLYDGRHFQIGTDANGQLVVGIGATYSFAAFSHGFAQGESFEVSISISGSLAKFYINGVYVFDFSFTPTVLTGSFYIGARNRIDNNNFDRPYIGNCQASYIIPKALTATEIQAHYNSPEKTLYWEGDTLKSDILDQTTIDSLQAGNGFWYPMTENISAGGYYRNHALPMPGNEFGNTTTWNLDTGFTINGNVVTANNPPQWVDIDTFISTIAMEYWVVEYQCTAVTSGGYRALIRDIESGTYLVNQPTQSTTGDYRFIVKSGNADLQFRILATTADNLVATFSVKAYPLANSGLTPLTNWTTTTVTNASPTGDGYQTAFVEQDSFGLPTALKKVNAGGITLADTTSEFAQQGLTLINNAGTLQLTKD